MVRALLIPILRRATPLAPLALGIAPPLALAGCIIPAPIEEEIPEEDLPPFVNQFTQVEPPLEVVRLFIGQGNPETFVFFDVEDPNEDQTLYWRWLVDYGGAAVASNITIIEPEDRLGSHPAAYYPCDQFHRPIHEGSAIDSYLFVIGISDSPFINTGSNFAGLRRIEDAFETEGPHEPVLIVWGIELEETCPDL